MHLIARVGSLVLALMGLFDDVPAQAVAQSPIVDGRPAVTLRLLADSDVWAPGHETRLAVHFALQPGWHIYGANPGSAGFPTAIAWTAPGVDVGPVAYPPPQMFKESDNVFTYGYSKNVALTATAHLMQMPQKEQVTVTARVRFLACNVICAPGEVTLSRTFAVAAQARSIAADSDSARALLDLGADKGAAGAETSGAPEPLAGGMGALARALGLAFLGGLILNAMPCVLPVLALKAMGLVQARHSRAQALAHAASYAGGVIGSMLALATVVLLVRAAGHSVGWGFQFQEPLFIAGVAVCMLVFACNCFGLFEIITDVNRLAQAHSSAQGLRRSVLEGVLAVLVATPCSAPFLGTAVAFALGQAAPVVVAVFVAVGAGLACPWVLLMLVPKLTRRLPKPGPWMGRLKVVLGYFLLATVAWLVWLFGRVRGVDDMALLLALLWATALAAYAAGQLTYAQPQRLWPVAFVLGCAIAGAGHMLLGGIRGGHDVALQAPYSEALVQAELALGHPVLVDFTADWCITCKYNEHHVLADSRVQTALTQAHVTVLRADWTRRDNVILAELMRHGRAGVPMYLLYSPHAPKEPLLLPEVLTVKMLVEAVAPL